MKKRTFDVIVIGAGSGLIISSQAAQRRLKVAVVEKGPFGGTCLNRGCIPSKMLIHSADVMETIHRAHLFGISTKVEKIDWKQIQKRVWSTIDSEAMEIERGNKYAKNITVYKKSAQFIGHKSLMVDHEHIAAEKIFICAGTRPSIPEISGLDSVRYYTSDDIMRISKQPKKMVILGGGYVSTELGHFFSSLGTDVTFILRGNMLLKNEDGDITRTFTDIVSRKYRVLFSTSINKISQRGKTIVMNITHNGKKNKLMCDTFLIAAGRIPNTDTLAVKQTGVKLTPQGFIEVNGYMETSVSGIWAIGDIAGKYMFKHSSNLEASYCAHNAFNPKSKIKVDYSAMPHAIFTSPQIAGVGYTEQELKEKGISYKVGKYRYNNTGMGKAIEDNDGFVKVLVEPKTKKILGCHIIGYDASTLIHEVIVAMKANLTIDDITRAVHVHPALSEVVQRAFMSVRF